MNLFVLTAIRSGSTYLIHLLRDTGFFHYPEPHSDHPSLIPQQEIYEFFAPNRQTEPWSIAEREKTRAECIDHLRYKLEHMVRQPCLFKVLMEQYRHYLLDGKDRPLIESMIPDLKYIWLERSDIVARTVSAYIFFKSKVDHIYDQKSYDEYMQKAVEIDEEGLLDVYNNHVKKCDWQEFLQGTNYLKIQYEDLIAYPKETLAKCLDHAGLGYYGLNLQAIVDHQPQFKTERPESEAWKEKLRQILKKGTL